MKRQIARVICTNLGHYLFASETGKCSPRIASHDQSDEKTRPDQQSLLLILLFETLSVKTIGIISLLELR